MKNREIQPTPYEADGTFVMHGRKAKGGRRLEFATHDGLGFGRSRACSRRECYQDAMKLRAARLASGTLEEAKLAAEVDAGIARHANACPKSPEAVPPIWAMATQPTAFNAVCAMLEGMGFSVRRKGVTS